MVCCPANRVKFQAKSPIADPPPTSDAARKFGAAAEAQAAGYVGQPAAPMKNDKRSSCQQNRVKNFSSRSYKISNFTKDVFFTSNFCDWGRKFSNL